jgi:hypothetical protein
MSGQADTLPDFWLSSAYRLLRLKPQNLLVNLLMAPAT